MIEVTNRLSYDSIYINPSFITICRNYVNTSNKVYSKDVFKSFNQNHSANGKMSIHAQKNLKRAIDWFYYNTSIKNYIQSGTKTQIKYKLVFITLTLPATQIHDDNYIKKYMLGQFLTELNQKYGVTDYCWRAEKQDNGNIHFHIITDKFLHWFLIRHVWNRICKKENYIQKYKENMTTRYKDGFVSTVENVNSDTYKRELRRYEDGVACNWSNPNSIDIKPIDNIKKCKAYISKYMTKNKKETRPDEVEYKKDDTVKGKIWYCSSKYLKIKNFATDVSSKIAEDLRYICDNLKDRISESDFYDVILLGIDEIKKLKLFGIYNWFREEHSLYFNT